MREIDRQRDKQAEEKRGEEERVLRRHGIWFYIEKIVSFNTFLTDPTLRWRHNERDGVSNHQPNDCLLNPLFRPRSKKTTKLLVIGLCAGNSPGTGEFPAQMASSAENVSIWWRHHVVLTHRGMMVNMFINKLGGFKKNMQGANVVMCQCDFRHQSVRRDTSKSNF